MQMKLDLPLRQMELALLQYQETKNFPRLLLHQVELRSLLLLLLLLVQVPLPTDVVTQEIAV